MRTDLSIVKKNLADLRSDSDQNSKFKIEFKKADGSVFTIHNLNIPKWLPEGEYSLTAWCLDRKEPEVILENEILIEAKKETPEPQPVQTKTNDTPDDLLLKIRKQDQEAWERERNLLEKYWQTEVARIRTEYSSREQSLIEKHQFEMNLLKRNGDVLESERDKIRESLAKELRIEKRHDNSSKKRTFGERFFDFVDGNPDLVIALVQKFNLVDAETVNALKEMNEATGAAAA